ncbi:amino acid ABC transporter permease [bacterium RCC_150]
MSETINEVTGRSAQDDKKYALSHGLLEPRRIVPKSRTGAWILGAVVLVVLASSLYTLLSRPALSWPVIWEYLFSPDIMSGLLITLYVTVIAMVLGLTFGLIAALMMGSKNPTLTAVASLYIWVFRAIPGLVQLLFWYNLASLFPTLEIGIPYGPVFWQPNPNEFMTPLLAACIALGVSEGAYMAEIIRAGLLSVSNGQREAAAALGLTSGQALRRVVLPQAMRTIIPPIGNSFIGMLKYTSLASVISVSELLHSAQNIYATNFQVIPLLIVASIWYLVVTSLLTLIQRQIESYFNRGFDKRPPAQNKKVTLASVLFGSRRPVPFAPRS